MNENLEPKPDAERLLDASATSEIVGLSKDTIRRQTKEGKFPCPIKIGRSVRWRYSEIMSWIARGPQ